MIEAGRALAFFDDEMRTRIWPVATANAAVLAAAGALLFAVCWTYLGRSSGRSIRPAPGLRAGMRLPAVLDVDYRVPEIVLRPGCQEFDKAMPGSSTNPIHKPGRTISWN